MRPLAALSLLLVSACTLSVGGASDTDTSDAFLLRARHVLRESPLIDGHNDLAWAIRTDSTAPHDVEAYDLRRRTRGHTDLARLDEGMVGGQFWSVYVPGDSDIARQGYAKVQLEQIDIARRFITKYPERFEAVTTADGFRAAFAAGHIGSALGMEGGHAIENSLGALRAFHSLGARYMTLTHNVTLDWADAAAGSPTHGGLTDFGREVVREMNRLGMLVDLSHVSPGTMSDALDVAEAPVIFSHSNARAIADHVRNVPDSILRRLPANGGVVMVTFVPGFTAQAVVEWNRIPAAQRPAGPRPAPRSPKLLTTSNTSVASQVWTTSASAAISTASRRSSWVSRMSRAIRASSPNSRAADGATTISRSSPGRTCCGRSRGRERSPPRCNGHVPLRPSCSARNTAPTTSRQGSRVSTEWSPMWPIRMVESRRAP